MTIYRASGVLWEQDAAGSSPVAPIRKTPENAVYQRFSGVYYFWTFAVKSLKIAQSRAVTM